MDKKLSTFLEIVKALNRHGIVPTLYGSLGLYRFIGQLDEIDDIDIVVPNIYLEDKFLELVEIMAEIGYPQDRKFPHEFTKGEDQIGFEPESELIEDTNVSLDDLKITKIDDAKFKELTPEHYMVLYRKDLKTREKKVEKAKIKIKALEGILKDKK